MKILLVQNSQTNIGSSIALENHSTETKIYPLNLSLRVLSLYNKFSNIVGLPDSKDVYFISLPIRAPSRVSLDFHGVDSLLAPAVHFHRHCAPHYTVLIRLPSLSFSYFSYALPWQTQSGDHAGWKARHLPVWYILLSMPEAWVPYSIYCSLVR